jgi:hypothetical protein
MEDVKCNRCNWEGRECDLWQEEEDTLEHCPNCNSYEFLTFNKKQDEK